MGSLIPFAYPHLHFLLLIFIQFSISTNLRCSAMCSSSNPSSLSFPSFLFILLFHLILFFKSMSVQQTLLFIHVCVCYQVVENMYKPVRESNDCVHYKWVHLQSYDSNGAYSAIVVAASAVAVVWFVGWLADWMVRWLIGWLNDWWIDGDDCLLTNVPLSASRI